MPYVINGTRTLIGYWRTLGRPCDRDKLSSAIKSPKIYFTGEGRDTQSLKLNYGEVEAQNLAAALGVAVSDVTTNGGQILI